MYKKKIVKIFFIFLFLLTIILFAYFKLKFNKTTNFKDENEDLIYNSNVIKDVEYKTKDKDGNEYFILANEGEIDYSNPSIIFLTKVSALVKLSNSDEVTIFSDFGKYNTENNDTIFSKNVIINYLDNKITSEYLDFSLKRNLMIISKNVIYSNLESVLKADVIEIDIKTKNSKIFMHNKEKKVNIKHNKNGNN